MKDKIPDYRPIHLSYAIGSIHLAFALLTFAMARTLFWQGPYSPVTLIGIPFFWVPSIAAFAAGMAPVYGYFKENLVSPLILLGVWIVWGSVNFALNFEDYPIAQLYAPEFLPPPNYDYFHQSILLSLMIAGLYLAERYLRRKEVI